MGISHPDSAKKPSRRQLDIADFVLRGEPSPELLHELSTQKMVVDALVLANAHKLIGEAEKHVVASMRSGTGAPPTRLELYALSEVAEPIKRLPVQLATLLADTIIIGAGQLETVEKNVRLKAIHGIADGIIRQSKKEHTFERASERIIFGILDLIDKRGVYLENEWFRVSLAARMLVLRQIAEFE